MWVLDRAGQFCSGPSRRQCAAEAEEVVSCTIGTGDDWTCERMKMPGNGKVQTDQLQQKQTTAE